MGTIHSHFLDSGTFHLLDLIGRQGVLKQKAARASRVPHVQIQKKEMRLGLQLERRLELTTNS